MVTTDFTFLLQTIAWPAVLLLAWFLAERLHETWHIPRVTSYVAVGLLGGLINLPGLTSDIPGLPFLANVALSLVLFELGYRINIRWFRHNPWVLLLGVIESVVTFGVVYAVSGWFDLPQDHRLIIAALSVSASPAGVVRVANELRSAGQVTERVLHLCAINCFMAVAALKLVIGYWYLSTSGDLVLAAFGSIHVLVTSVAVGGLLGVAVPWLLRLRSTPERGVTVVFALSVLLLTTATFGFRLSPLLAALSFGIVARERRVHLTNAQRDFGTAGDLLSVFLFVYIASLLEWATVGTGLLLGLSVGTVQRMVQNGVFKAFVTHGGHRRILSESLNDYCKGQGFLPHPTPATAGLLCILHDSAHLSQALSTLAQWAHVTVMTHPLDLMEIAQDVRVFFIDARIPWLHTSTVHLQNARMQHAQECCVRALQAMEQRRGLSERCSRILKSRVLIIRALC